MNCASSRAEVETHTRPLGEASVRQTDHGGAIDRRQSLARHNSRPEHPSRRRAPFALEIGTRARHCVLRQASLRSSSRLSDSPSISLRWASNSGRRPRASRAGLHCPSRSLHLPRARTRAHGPRRSRWSRRRCTQPGDPNSSNSGFSIEDTNFYEPDDPSFLSFYMGSN